jgi:hypothetical protein
MEKDKELSCVCDEFVIKREVSHPCGCVRISLENSEKHITIKYRKKCSEHSSCEIDIQIQTCVRIRGVRRSVLFIFIFPQLCSHLVLFATSFRFLPR